MILTSGWGGRSAILLFNLRERCLRRKVQQGAQVGRHPNAAERDEDEPIGKRVAGPWAATIFGLIVLMIGASLARGLPRSPARRVRIVAMRSRNASTQPRPAVWIGRGRGMVGAGSAQEAGMRQAITKEAGRLERLQKQKRQDEA